SGRSLVRIVAECTSLAASERGIEGGGRESSMRSVLRPEYRRRRDHDVIGGRLGDDRRDQDEVEANGHLELIVADSWVDRAAASARRGRVFAAWRVGRRGRLDAAGRIGLGYV